MAHNCRHTTSSLCSTHRPYIRPLARLQGAFVHKGPANPGLMSLGSISMDPTLKATMVRHTHFKGLRLGTLTWVLFTAAKTNLVHPLTLASLNSFAFWKHRETKRSSVFTPIKTLHSSKVNWLLDFSPPKLNKPTRVVTSPPRMRSLNAASD